MRRVLIAKCRAETFRVPFYETLGDALADRGIELTVIYGQPDGDDGEPDPPPFRYGLRIHNKYMSVGSTRLVWQPVLKHIRGADLVVVQQGNRNLVNSFLQIVRGMGGVRLAFWGHGRNFQALRHNSPAESLKRLSSRWVDHWFAYTEATRLALLESRVPEGIITVVNNSIDTTSQQRFYEEVDETEVRETRRRLSIPEGVPTGIYCGRMYDIKKIPFLLGSLEVLKRSIPNFHFLALGLGPDAPMVEQFARNNSWFRHVGRAAGREKAVFFRLADVHVAPGALGLSIVDSFAMLTPVVTTLSALHGPEFCYLEHGRNGLRLDEQAFAAGVAELLGNKTALQKLRAGCDQARRIYTMDAMVANFVGGVMRALGESKAGGGPVPAPFL